MENTDIWPKEQLQGIEKITVELGGGWRTAHQIKRQQETEHLQKETIREIRTVDFGRTDGRK